MEEILRRLEAQLGRLQDDGRSRTLDQVARDGLKKRIEWDDANFRQTFKQKDRMFFMVFCMTIITYSVVLLIILSQVIDLQFPTSFSEFVLLKWVKFYQLDNQRLALILAGFLAELLLLPKIILTGLFQKK